MRIGCLQFAPQVGDIDNNLNRADAVLAKADPGNVDALDLLVLPELAFTGYNFKSLREISPHLEPSGSGISSLWARTTALKYNCTVVVGYPEKVDVSSKWPASPEYYNSAIIVNGEGETIANYRKSFLYVIDQSWALEGRDGFFERDLDGLGCTALGICMDINPYKFEALWHAFEFAFHILEVEANLVIVTMAWLTREDGRMFSRMPQEPDMETLTYWIQRLEPVIRAEKEEETIVVFCNRTGTEDEVVYAGTSAVIGIKDGEVNVYGLLGRGVKELLVVDTDDGPCAKLVHRPEGEEEEIDAISRPGEAGGQSPVANMKFHFPRPPQGDSSASLPSTKPTSTEPAAEATGYSPSNPKKERPSPKLEIPEFLIPLSNREGVTMIDESPTILTPTGPSPIPQSLRPRLVIPETGQPYRHTPSPYPQDAMPQGQFQIFGGHVSISEEYFTPSSVFKDPSTAELFWVPSSTLLYTPVGPNWMPVLPNSPMVAKFPDFPAKSLARPVVSPAHAIPSPTSERSSGSAESRGSNKSRDQECHAPQEGDRKPRETVPPRPSSPKSRNASRSRHERSTSTAAQHGDIAAVFRRLEALARSNTPATNRPEEQSSITDRPRSPKSRNASRTRPTEELNNTTTTDRLMNQSRSSILIAASPSIFQSEFQALHGGTIERPGSSRAGANAIDVGNRPASRTSSQIRPGLDSAAQPGSRSTSVARQAEIDLLDAARSRSRETMRSQIPKDFNVSNIINSDCAQILRPHLRKNQPGSLGTGDDEIIAIAELILPECQIHGNRGSPNNPNSPRPIATVTRVSPRLLDHTFPREGRNSGEITIYKAPSPLDTQGNARAVGSRHTPSSILTTSLNSLNATTSPKFEPQTPRAMAFVPKDQVPISPSSLSDSAPSTKDGSLDTAASPKGPKSLNRRKSAVW